MNAKGISVLKEEIQYHKECIEKIEKILALSESQSVSDNEGEKKGCHTCKHRGKAPNPPCWHCMMPSYVKYERAT